MSNILKEALADSKTLKAAALKNAQNLILENMRNDLKEMVEDQMNETDDADSDDLGGLDLDLSGGGEEGGDDLDSEEEMTTESADGDADDSDDDSEDESISESDLQEALREAMTEVSHGSLGEIEFIDPDSHPTGLMDQDKSEKGWDEKTAPAKKNFTVKEAAYKRQIAKLVAENVMLRKTNNTLRSTVNEVNLFNTKLHYSYKLLNKEGLDLSTKKSIVKKFDSVKTVSEAKTLFESLQLAFGALSENSKKKSKNSLSEALGVQGGSTNGRNVSNVGGRRVMNESVEQSIGENPFDISRMQHLAGIKK
jgi:hypothetical protein